MGDGTTGGMSDRDRQKAARLAAALRENLRKRKAQARELEPPATREDPSD